MSVGRQKRRHRGLTRVEVLAMLAALALLVVVALPLVAHPAMSSHRAVCANNLRRISQAFHVFAQHNDGQFPWLKTNNAPIHYYFIWAGTELGDTRIVVCPSDFARQPALSFSNTYTFISSMNLSYLLNTDSKAQQAGAWLSGDRNVSASGKITSASSCAWDARMNHSAEGNVVTVDGRVEQVNTAGLQNFVSRVLAKEYPIYLMRP